MRDLRYGAKALLVDDELADSLVEYAAALARSNGSDTVTIRALGTDGNEVEATMLLNANSQIIAETVTTQALAPSNHEVVAYLKVHTLLINNPPPIQPDLGPPDPE